MRARLLLLGGLVLSSAGGARAEATEIRYGAALFGGATRLDPELDRYRWDVGPRPQLGGELRATRGRFGLGLRGSWASTEQGTGIPGEPDPSGVRLQSLELLARVRLHEATGLWAVLGGGRMNLRYSPSEREFDVEGGGAITVRYDPISEWTVGYGLAAERRLGTVALGLHLEHRSFSLDTAHRNGDDVEERRERFGNWAGHLSLGLTFGGS